MGYRGLTNQQVDSAFIGINVPTCRLPMPLPRFMPSVESGFILAAWGSWVATTRELCRFSPGKMIIVKRITDHFRSGSAGEVRHAVIPFSVASAQLAQATFRNRIGDLCLSLHTNTHPSTVNDRSYRRDVFLQVLPFPVRTVVGSGHGAGQEQRGSNGSDDRGSHAMMMRPRGGAPQENKGQKSCTQPPPHGPQQPHLPRHGAGERQQLIHRGPGLTAEPRVHEAQPVGHQRARTGHLAQQTYRRQPSAGDLRHLHPPRGQREQPVLHLQAFAGAEPEAYLPQPLGKCDPDDDLVFRHGHRALPQSAEKANAC